MKNDDSSFAISYSLVREILLLLAPTMSVPMQKLRCRKVLYPYNFTAFTIWSGSIHLFTSNLEYNKRKNKLV